MRTVKPLRLYTSIFLLILFSEYTFSQKADDETIRKKLAAYHKQDTTRFNLLNTASLLSQNVNFSQSLDYANQALALAEALAYRKGVAMARNNLAYCYRVLGDGDLAVEHALEAELIAETDRLDEVLIESYRLLGVIYSDQGNFEKAKTFAYRAEQLGMQKKLEYHLPKVYNALGFILFIQKRKEYDSALMMYDKGLAFIEKGGDSTVAPYILGNKGSIFFFVKNKPDEGLACFRQSLAIAQRHHDKFAESVALAEVSRAFILRKEFPEAEKNLMQSTAIAEQLGLKIILKHNYLTMIDLYMSQGRFWEAHTYMKKRYALRDSIINEQKARQMLELEARYESEKKEQAIQILRQEKRIQVIWIVGSLLLAVTLGFIYRLQRLRTQKTKQLLETQTVLNSKLKETDLLKSRFFANISHEFRTPLSLILAPIEDKLASSTLSEADRDDLRLVKRNANRLLDLINQLLDLSKLEAGKLKLRIQAGNLEEFVKVLAASFDSYAEARKITFEKDIAVQSENSWFDKDKLEKMISNTLFNAFKFTPPGGRVKLSIYSVHQELIVKVEDTGRGISAEDLPHVFTLFYQSKNVADDGQPGTGLGLSLVHELVKLHDGKIGLTSRVNEGTTITISLPTAKEVLPYEDEVSVRIDSPDKVSAPDFRNEDQGDAFEDSILIIEDNDDLRQYIASCFQHEFNIITSKDGEEGLSVAIDQVPDLIISDVMMPKMDGLELAEKLKLDEHTSHIPIIMLTAKADEGSRLEGFKKGADDYLAKPFSTEELRVRVKNLIQARKKLAARYRDRIAAPEQSVQLPSMDEKFLINLRGVIEANIGNSGFSVEQLAEEMCLSRTQLFRKVKALLEMSPNELINDVRLQRAAELIRAKVDTLTQISYSVGFNEQSYFAKRFRKKFGVTPSEYLNS